MTPYDITPPPRPVSCTWEIDVTDYMQLLRGDVLHTEGTLAGAGAELRARLGASARRLGERGDVLVVEIAGDAAVTQVLKDAIDGGAQVVEVTPRRETLEDLFLRRAL